MAEQTAKYLSGTGATAGCITMSSNRDGVLKFMQEEGLQPWPFSQQMATEKRGNQKW